MPNSSRDTKKSTKITEDEILALIDELTKEYNLAKVPKQQM